jgi:hypothetical protein
MKFKDWLIAERERFIFDKPITMSIWVDQNKTKKITANLIDVRWEDWSLEGKEANTPLFQTPLSKSFSAPLADGRYLNWHSEGNYSIDQQALFRIIRKDWARFAEFINGNVVVKNPQYLRPGDYGTKNSIAG